MIVTGIDYQRDLETEWSEGIGARNRDLDYWSAVGHDSNR
jgi:hypothetical protein